MVRKHVRIFIEGGSVGSANTAAFREGWKKFLTELHDLARANGYHSLEVVKGLGRANTFNLFKSNKIRYPDDLCVLLVDSETLVEADARVWDVVASRRGDGWQKPEWASDRHLYLMIVMVETWLLTDPETLSDFFGRGFEQRHIPNIDLENRSKEDVDRALKRATTNCRSRPYRHGQAHEIIKFVKPEEVRKLKHGRRLFEELGSLIQGQ